MPENLCLLQKRRFNPGSPYSASVLQPSRSQRPAIMFTCTWRACAASQHVNEVAACSRDDLLHTVWPACLGTRTRTIPGSWCSSQ